MPDINEVWIIEIALYGKVPGSQLAFEKRQVKWPSVALCFWKSMTNSEEYLVAQKIETLGLVIETEVFVA